MNTTFRLITTACLCSVLGSTALAADDDPYLWLEEVNGDKALEWVKKKNEVTLARLTSDPRYETLLEENLTDMTRSDRLPGINLIGGNVYDLLRDADHRQGLLRRMSVSDFAAGGTDWEAVLDIDALSKKDNVNWVWRSASCLAPQEVLCVLGLSPGGSDASVYREFDLAKKSFVKNGFEIPEAKSTVAWYDADHLVVAIASSPEDSTASGYGRKARLWKRGTTLLDSPVVMEVDSNHMGVMPQNWNDGDTRYTVLSDAVTIFDHKLNLLQDGGKVIALPLPDALHANGMVDGAIYGTLKADWTQGATAYRAGDMLAFDLENIKKGGLLPNAELMFRPSESQAISSLLGGGTVESDKAVYFSVLDHVVGKLVKVNRGDGWEQSAIDLPGNGTIQVLGSDKKTGTIFSRYENLITPPTVYAMGTDDKPKAIKSLKPKFDASGLETVQHFATSKDGTQVPYFVIKPKNIKMDGSTPTLMGAYGGFSMAVTPAYMSMFAHDGPFKTMVTHGGIYVLANIRGGGEYGPKWHSSAILTERQNVYNDFHAVAEDLIQRGYTRPEKLGITGASNSGLLVGVAFTQRPDLYGAVLCGVPLLDMKRYHKMLAGASWMAEYGDPDDPQLWDVIKTYSPYHNVRENQHYTEVFFYSSTKDDRVHPGHARKMVARMEAQGHEFLYFENMEGGHGAAANLEQTARLGALKSVYLLQQLFDGKASPAKEVVGH